MVLSLEPGFLDFDNLPDTNFTCVGKVIGGYYADLETNCQMFHVCTIGQADEPMDIRFLCLNGTVFDQETRVCERIDEVDCSKSEQFYSLNLELYGNSGPILEETPDVPHETEPSSIIIKPTTSTTTTTTTKKPTYYTTIRPSIGTTSIKKPQAVPGHHFPVSNPDIRFNPEEINISLNPDSPPDIRTKHYQPHQSFSDSSTLLVTGSADNDEEQSVRVQKPERGRLSSPTSPKSIYALDGRDKLNENSDDNFGFSDEDFPVTELPRQQQQQFLIQTNSFRHSQSFPPNVNHNSNQYHHPQFHSTTVKQPTNFHQDSSHTTARTIYLYSLKPPEIHQHHHYTHHPRTEKTPQRVQIPIPLLPTLPPLTFSSPAPFTLQRHIENKRYTKDHQEPPRIIISASASVSDASGRRLNYSLGTIGAAHILESPPSSYDEYKDSDVGLDPFYHDVPKVSQKKRRKRSIEEKQINPFEIIKNEKDAVEVLKFLFTWYQSHQATATVSPVTSPVSPDLIKAINQELAPLNEGNTLKSDSSEIYFTSFKEPTSTESLKPGYRNSELFSKGSRYSIVGGHRNENVESRASPKRASREDIEDKEKEVENIDSKGDEKNFEYKIDLLDGNNKPSKVGDKIDAKELKEKMDNADIAVFSDTKEVSFNPDDYVDDNYEGIVYKENINSKERITARPVENSYSKEEEASTTLAEVKGKEHFVEPFAVSELYKYFNINTNNLTTEKSISSIPANEKNDNDLEINAKEFEHNDRQKIDESKTVVNNTLKEFDRHTEINVFSEVHEAGDVSQNSTISAITTTTTTTVTPSKQQIRRRGRGRQRQHTDSYQEASYNSDISQPQINGNQEVRNYISAVENNSWRSTSKRGQNRGRSRFTNPASFTSTSTTTSTTTTVIPTTENLNDQQMVIYNDTTSTFVDVTHAAEVNEHNTASSEATRTTEKESELKISNGISNSTSEHNEQIINEKIPQNLDEINIRYLNKNESELPAGNIDNIEVINEGNHNDSLLVTEGEELLDLQENLNTSYDKNHVLHQDSTALNYTQGETVGGNEITSSTITNTITIESVTEPLIIDLPKEDYDEPISELNPSTSTSEDPSYLIKLLRYYAETAMTAVDQPATTEHPEVSYDSITESQITSTPYPMTNDYSHDYKVAEEKRNRQRGRHRHSSRVSTTELPTLRDVYQNTRPYDTDKLSETTKTLDGPVTTNSYSLITPVDPKQEEIQYNKSKFALLERLSLIEHNLAGTTSATSLPIADTTVTTPLVSFEESESFGTTLSSVTNPTIFVKDHTVTEELTKMFETSTETTKNREINKNFNSFYDDVFVVPELTEKNPKLDGPERDDNYERKDTEHTTINTTSLSETYNNNFDVSMNTTPSITTIIVEDTTEPITTIEEPKITTALPDVEIQKSISLPIAVLDTSFNDTYDVSNVHDINSLLSTTKGDDVEGKTTAILDIPSTLPTTQAEEEHTTETLSNEVTETVPITLSTTEVTDIGYTHETFSPKHVEEHLGNLQDTVMPEVRQNATEIIFVKNRESSLIETPGMVNSSHLLQVVVETSTIRPVTTTLSTITTAIPHHTRRTRPPRRRPYKNERNQFGRHRFNTELFTNKPPEPKEVLYKQNLVTSQNITDAPLHRSATPTRSELKKVLLHTTPLSSKNSRTTPTKVSKHYVFNCFGKEINKFYADPRDCRLFHYCTQGYSKNQLLDLKYVCDQKTFFDEEKLICTKVKPARCL